MADVGEFGLIERLDAQLASALAGRPHDDDLLTTIGDDAAVYRVAEGRVHIITTDALIEGVHFDRRFAPMRQLGAKALGVNVSDVCAMNGRPRYATVALGMAPGMSVEDAEALYKGIGQAAKVYGLRVVGGDVTAARQITLSVTVVGEAREEDVVYRRGAEAGDLLCTTGPLGGAFGGLKVLLEQQRALMEKKDESFQPDLAPFQPSIRRQLVPSARLGAVEAWAEAGVRPHALIDISDGLASEVHHLCEHSRTGCTVELDALPIDDNTRAVAKHFGDDPALYALYGGEDYELLYALAPEDREKLDPKLCRVVGTFTEREKGVRLLRSDGEKVPLRAEGYQHFGEV